MNAVIGQAFTVNEIVTKLAHPFVDTRQCTGAHIHAHARAR